MHHAIWKLTALAVVVGIGVLVVVQAQRGFNQAAEDAQTEGESDPALDRVEKESPDDADTFSTQTEPALSIEGFDDESPAVPASAKTASSSRRRERPATLEGDDPFTASDELRAQTPRRVVQRADARDRAAVKARHRTDAADEDLSLEEDPPAKARILEESDDDDPFASESRSKAGATRTKPAGSGRGPTLRLSPLDEDDQAANEKPLTAPEDDKETDSNSGPRLLSDLDDSPPRLKPAVDDDAEPFGDEEPTIRRVRTDDSAIEKTDLLEKNESSEKDDGDDLLGAAQKDDEPKKLPESAGARSNERESADDEMPILERAAPLRKPASPAVPRADEEPNGNDDDAFPGIGKRDAGKQEPRRLTTDREPAVPLDDEPADESVKRTPSRTSADPFGDDEPEGNTKAVPQRSKVADEDESISRGRPAGPFLEEDAPATVPKPRPSVRPSIDDRDDPASFGLEPQRARPAPPLTSRDETPAVDLRSTEPGDETIDKPSPTAVETRPAPRRTPQPQLTIDKIAPPTAVLGKPMVYQIIVKNVGTIAARQVVVEDAVPDAARIDGSIPQALLENQRLIWKIGTLEAGHEKKIQVRIIPQTEGTLGTVATVNCAHPDQATNPAAPQLKFDVITPSQAVVGDSVAFKFRVTNVGEVDASGVVIRSVLPASLKHPDGDDLEYEIGALPAGKEREVELTLMAAQAGKTVNRAIVTAEGNVTEEASASLEIAGPALTVTRTGSKRLFPGKTGAYTNTITNPSSQPVANVRVVETIPPGMEFVSASEGGQYDEEKRNGEAKRSVTWMINQLAPQEAKALKVTLKTIGRGAQVSVVRAVDASGARGETVGTTQVAGVPALTIDMGDLAPHIEIGEQVRVPVRLINRGSDIATNIRASVTVPAGLKLVSVKAPVEYKAGIEDDGDGGSSRSVLVFSPINRLDPRADVVIELTLKAGQAGSARLKVEVGCEQVTEPVRREEVTTIAAPQE